MDFPSKSPEFALRDTDPDEVRAFVSLVDLYCQLYLRRSDAHRIIFLALAKRTFDWMRGREQGALAYLSREALRRALRSHDAEVSDKTIDSVLRTIALDLSVLGFSRGRGGSVRGRYDGINMNACTVSIGGQRRVMYLAGPTPIDRGEREQQDALFLEPRFIDIGVQPVGSALTEIGVSPFEHVFLRCQLHATGPEASSTVLAVFAAAPLSLHGRRATLNVANTDLSRDGSFDEELETETVEPDTEARSAPRYASARVYGDTSMATLDGEVVLHPLVRLSRVEPVLQALPATALTRIGFRFSFRVDTASNRDSVEAMDGRLVGAVIEVLRAKGPIVRRDPYIGDVVRVLPDVELGVWADTNGLIVTFQRTSSIPLFEAVRDYPLGSLVAAILERAA